MRIISGGRGYKHSSRRDMLHLSDTNAYKLNSAESVNWDKNLHAQIRRDNRGGKKQGRICPKQRPQRYYLNDAMK